MENEMRKYMDMFKQRLNESSNSMDHNFSIYDDIESELAEIPNDEAVEYLMGIIKHCEKLIKELSSIVGKRVIWQGKEHTIYDLHQDGDYVMLDDKYGPSVEITELQFID
jgi:hypothetical protein